MKLERIKEQGRILNNDDLFEFREMYYSGEYTAKEICEWFGITYWEFHIYTKIVNKKFGKENCYEH
jgi:hypothetical protein